MDFIVFVINWYNNEYKKVNVFMGIIFFKLYFIYLVFKNVFRKLGNILIELLKKK